MKFKKNYKSSLKFNTIRNIKKYIKLKSRLKINSCSNKFKY